MPINSRPATGSSFVYYTVEGYYTFKAIFIRNKDKKDDGYRIPVTGIE